jgi:hypothetical protein
MVDYHLIRFAGREEHRQAIEAFDNVHATRVVLPGHRMVVTSAHIQALERANVPFEYVTPTNANGQHTTPIQS